MRLPEITAVFFAAPKESFGQITQMALILCVHNL